MAINWKEKCLPGWSIRGDRGPHIPTEPWPSCCSSWWSFWRPLPAGWSHALEMLPLVSESVDTTGEPRICGQRSGAGRDRWADPFSTSDTSERPSRCRVDSGSIFFGSFLVSRCSAGWDSRIWSITPMLSGCSLSVRNACPRMWRSGSGIISEQT